MLKEAGHIINKEVFEFTYSQSTEAFALQKQMDGGLQYNVNRILSNSLDEYNVSDEPLYIDKLEIDLGKIPYDQLEQLAPARFHSLFKDKLSAAISQKRNLPVYGGQKDGGGAIQLLELFLLSGNLPWWAGRSSDFSLKETINLLLRNSPAELRSLLAQHIRNEKVKDRLFYQVDTEQYLQLAGLLNITAELVDVVQRSLEKLKLLAHVLETSAQRQKNIVRLILKLMGSAELPISSDELQELFSEKVGHRNNIPGEDPTLTKGELPEPDHAPGRAGVILIEKIKEVWGNYAGSKTDEIGLTKTISRDIYSAGLAVENIFADDKIAIQPSRDGSYPPASFHETGEKIFIQNTGLVLIASFLPALFNELAWVANGVFKDKEYQFKALFLLHYLCTGQTESPEYTLQLNKVLCGLKQDEPVPLSVELSDREKQEAYQLLQDVITHWTALKASSVEGLQGTFLLRDGLLSFHQERWLLQAERKGYDILLDQIPWSWQTIKMNWMDTYLNTEW